MSTIDLRPEPAPALAERLRERLRRDGVDPVRRPEEARRIAWDLVRAHNEHALARGLGPLLDESSGVQDALAAVSGYGALQAYLDDPGIEEIWINAPDRIFAARAGVSERLPVVLTHDGVRDLVERMLHTTGRRVDLSTPFVDASLPDGSRLHVAIPDVTARHWAVNIRRFHARLRSLDALVEIGSLPASASDLLREAVVAGRSILVSGATQAGKTTLLCALLSASPDGCRIVSVEETFELAIGVDDVVALQGRAPNLEGGGEITLRRLVKEALRMRPDRIVVGEVRDAEALDLVLALNTGVPGMASIHADSADDALVRLTALPLLAGRNIDAGFVRAAVARSLDLVVHCERDASGRRRITEIVAPTGSVVDDVIATRVVWSDAWTRR